VILGMFLGMFLGVFLGLRCRGDRTRTCDLLLPKQAR
jgi:hypothetical protein